MAAFVVQHLEGEAAATAWHAYRRNRSGFSHKERTYAEGIATPSLALFVVLCSCWDFDSSSKSLSVEGWQAADAGRNAVAMLITGPATRVLARTSRPLLYMHARAVPAGRGRGHVDRLLRELQDLMPSNGALTASAVACQTWFASLVLLRNGFGCSDELLTAEVPFPGENIDGGSSSLTFVWKRGVSAAAREHIAFVAKAELSQRARGSTRAVEYADALAKVLMTLGQVATTPNAVAEPVAPNAVAQSVAPNAVAEPVAPNAVAEPVAMTTKRKAAQQARTDRHHPSAPQPLPPDWREEWRDAPKRSYRVCIGPNGERSLTVKGAWAMHDA